MKFRQDIEGLRGIAVLMVLLCHASVPGFSGGFIGVDLFFVISGYLISGLLISELKATGRVDFAHFYARRIKRLLGALLVMLAIVCVFCIWLLPQPLQAIQAPSAFFSALWSSNIFFAYSNAGYFDNQTQQSAFLHTWSLGVEEQFYLIWPVLLAALFRFRIAKNHLVSAIFAAGLLSALACMMLSAQFAAQAYYLMPTRIWQFACGALAWLIPNRLSQLQTLGTALIAASLILISDLSPFPWPWAVLPVVGTALIVSNESSTSVAYKALTLRPMRFLGRISYSLYLWHWPLLVMAAYFLPGIGWAEKCVVLLIAVTIATMSERWVERPLRAGRWPAVHTVKAGVLATIIFACAIWLWKDSASRLTLPSAASDPLANRIHQEISLPDLYRIPGFDDFYSSGRFIPMVAHRPQTKPRKRVLIAGDSIAMHWLPAFEEIARRNEWELMAATKSSCPMLDVPVVNGRIKRRYTECETWRASLLEYVNEYSPDLILLGNSTSLGLDDQEWISGGRRILESVATEERDVFLIASSPKLDFDPIPCLLVNGQFVGDKLEGATCSSPINMPDQLKDRTRLAKIVDQFPRARVLILDDVVCPASTCSATRNGHLVYRDMQHLNARFVETLGLPIQEKLLEIAP